MGEQLIIHDKTKNVIDYNHSIKPYILDICRPLLENFNITYFEYDQINENGQVFYLCTNNNWLEFSLDQGMFDDEEHVKLCSLARCNNYRYALWNSLNLQNTHLLSRYYDHDIWNGLTINENEGELFHIYSFASTKSNTSINNFFINNLHLFDRFVIYFRQKLSELMIKFPGPTVNATPLIKDIETINSYYNNIDLFIENTSLDRFCFVFKNKKINLTKREIVCLSMLASGKSMKEIGRELQISHRTVESHLNVIRVKTGLVYKNQLISLFKNFPLSVLLP